MRGTVAWRVLVGSWCCVSACTSRRPDRACAAFAPSPFAARRTQRGTAFMSAAGDNFEALAFGPKITIPGEHIFFQSALSAAFVNLKPIVPGHVLVVPKRSVPRENQLSDEESVDLWRSVRRVSAVIEKEYGAAAQNIAMQDGKQAGQSVPHVHFHILPRRSGDFENNDDIYGKPCPSKISRRIKVARRQLLEWAFPCWSGRRRRRRRRSFIGAGVFS
jgi:bis(5'-adenosyl)-triphosphatase